MRNSPIEDIHGHKLESSNQGLTCSSFVPYFIETATFIEDIDHTYYSDEEDQKCCKQTERKTSVSDEIGISCQQFE
jgi:hypothetical protein